MERGQEVKAIFFDAANQGGAVPLLEGTPDVGTRFHRTFVPGVRRIVMKTTRHFVYYIHDAMRAVVYIIAVWGTPKGGDPVLLDPR